jgi:hypothetical protein
VTNFAWSCVFETLFIGYGSVTLVLLGLWVGGADGVTLARAVLWPLLLPWWLTRYLA